MQHQVIKISNRIQRTYVAKKLRKAEYEAIIIYKLKGDLVQAEIIKNILFQAEIIKN